MNTKLIVYGHEYCVDAMYLKSYLNKNAIDYEWRDVANGDPHFKDELRLLARGYLSVPTVVFPDGEVLVEPNPKEVLAKLR
ncbi:MAG: glutaredoxin family protein [Chloroflexota bacterium]|nr:glutaredoxin family protein [Chloroflexota bacterium]